MVDVAGWAAGLDEVDDVVGRRFVREEPRARAGVYVRGLLAGLERKNGWTLAEHAGAVSPDGMQRLLRTADWDIDGVRDDVRDYALDELGDPATGTFVLDDTGFVKKGRRSAGVQRQYTGTTGKIDNCQLGVFLAYASSKGRALIDRELYLPTSWTGDPERCAKAGIPAQCCAEGGFATKPELGISMLHRAYQAGSLTSSSWVTADEAYGQNPTVRQWLLDREIPFVLATRNDDLLTSPDGNRRPAKVLATIASVDENGHAGTGWERRSIGPGAHGDRVYDWIAIALDADPDTSGLPDGWAHWLLVRRQTEPGEGKTVRELGFYRCAGPAATPLRELIRVAGARWAIEECFQTAKNEAGLDQYQVRTWRAWYAHITLSMLATAYLAVTRAREHHRDRAEEKGEPQPASMSGSH